MLQQSSPSLLTTIFGNQKGSGTALLFLCLAIFGVVSCLIFRRNKEIWQLEKEIDN